MITLLACVILTPFRAVPRPLMSSPISLTLSFTPALTLIALLTFVSTPAVTPSALIVIDLLIVTAPKPPGSSTLISPFAAVFDIAPGKVLQGAVRLQGFASSPTPDTHVRVACPKAAEGIASAASASAETSMAVRREVNMEASLNRVGRISNGQIGSRHARVQPCALQPIRPVSPQRFE